MLEMVKMEASLQWSELMIKGIKASSTAKESRKRSTILKKFQERRNAF